MIILRYNFLSFASSGVVKIQGSDLRRQSEDGQCTTLIPFRVALFASNRATENSRPLIHIRVASSMTGNAIIRQSAQLTSVASSLGSATGRASGFNFR